MVGRLWSWFQSWMLWHHLGFHEFGYALHTVSYIALSFELTYRGRDVMRPLSRDYDCCDTCGQVRVER